MQLARWCRGPGGITLARGSGGVCKLLLGAKDNVVTVVRDILDGRKPPLVDLVLLI